MGRLMDILNALTHEEAFWLVTELPEQLTLAEYIASIVKDAYAEESQ